MPKLMPYTWLNDKINPIWKSFQITLCFFNSQTHINSCEKNTTAPISMVRNVTGIWKNENGGENDSNNSSNKMNH